MKCYALFALLIHIHLFRKSFAAEKFRVCVVDGRGGFKRTGKYCPVLDKPESKVECVIGIDRLDCLRRLSKGKVDFSVFTPEDLVTALNSDSEVLVTNEMRFSKEKYEYQVVAIVNDESGIVSKHDLRDKRLCHPGYGYETDWNHILANYLEVSTVPQTCNPKLSLTENRISSSASYFKAACKAGPWVYDPLQDAELKRNYPNLCELCDLPEKCGMSDKYWGRQGPLYCLTDGIGDVSWVRLDDALLHFSNQRDFTQISSSGFSYLCQDGTTQPVNSTRTPCVWVVKPWPLIAAQRKRAHDVQELFEELEASSEQRTDWETALFSLIEQYKQDIVALDNVEPIESYLESAPGFLSANSFPGCHPPRTIRICSTSNVANAKCAWMRGIANVYGIEPDIDCIKANNVTHCMEAIQIGAADVVITPPDYVNIGKRIYDLQTILYETVNDNDKYVTVAVVKADSHFKTLQDLRGARACFPLYDGIAWNSLLHALNVRNLFAKCPFEEGMAAYFGDSCIPNLPANATPHLRGLCASHEEYTGDYGALKCLAHKGDVAFISKNSLENFFNDPKQVTGDMEKQKFRIICDDAAKPCHYSWAPIGQMMTSLNKSTTWIKDTVDVFYEIDYIFGRHYKTVTNPFTLFGVYDTQSNVLFDDATMKLRKVPYYKNSDKMMKNYDALLEHIGECNTAPSFAPQLTLLCVLWLTISRL